MNAETRAKERSADPAHVLALQVVNFKDSDGLDKRLAEYDRVKALIATAIRQAENDKLEEAALMLEAGRDHMRSKANGANARILSALVTELAVDIRSLKSKD